MNADSHEGLLLAHTVLHVAILRAGKQSLATDSPAFNLLQIAANKILLSLIIIERSSVKMLVTCKAGEAARWK